MAIRGMLRKTLWYKDDRVASLSALCPACGFEHSFNVNLYGDGPAQQHTWEFDGNYDSPTFSPSMLSNKEQIDSHHPLCHSFVKAGVWEFLADCTHEMAGQEVPMIPPVPDMTFERRHGWHLYPWCDPETGKPLKTET